MLHFHGGLPWRGPWHAPQQAPISRHLPWCRPAAPAAPTARPGVPQGIRRRHGAPRAGLAAGGSAPSWQCDLPESHRCYAAQALLSSSWSSGIGPSWGGNGGPPASAWCIPGKCVLSLSPAVIKPLKKTVSKEPCGTGPRISRHPGSYWLLTWVGGSVTRPPILQEHQLCKGNVSCGQFWNPFCVMSKLFLA